VLEHVTDPFRCAAELARVLKPGGTLYCVAPMLQPEHGYPEHYYNMTRSGLRRLFDGRLEVREQFVPLSGHPVFALHWMASWYLEHLPIQAKKRLESMSFGELVGRSPMEWLGDEIVSQLSKDGEWKLACTTAILLTKRATPAT
ncbi:MAG TPA: methyltransferase domain-containing protein, partial [Polyangiaceae bacterium]